MKSKYLIWLPIFLVAFYFTFLPAVSYASSQLVIDEFRIGTQVTASDEFIVIANYSDTTIDLGDYSLQKRTSTGASPSKIYTFPTAYMILPNQRLVLANKGYTGKADIIYSTYISADYTLYIKDNFSKIVDMVGYGDCQEAEGQPLPSVEADQNWKRMNGQDTDDNLNDFYYANAPKPIPVDPNTPKLLISELYPNPNVGEKEWIEIFNPTNQMINLFGLKVCDVVGSVHCYSFTENETLAPFSYKTYDQTLTRITLNNDTDAALLIDANDNLIFSTSEYEDAAKGESFSLFATEWQWTQKPTGSADNLFVSTIEEETEKVMTKTTKAKKAKTKVTSTAEVEKEVEAASANEIPQAVKGSQTENQAKKTAFLGKKQIGIGLIILAILLVIGYTLFENKEKLYEALHKFSRRDN